MRRKFARKDFYFRDFADGVRGMPRDQVGDYMRLLCALWDRDDEVLPLDVDVLHLILECRRSDVAARIRSLVDRGKIYVGEDWLIHNLRTDLDAGRSPQVAGKLRRSSAEVAAKLKPHNRKNATNSTEQGTSSRARAPSPSPKKGGRPPFHMRSTAANLQGFDSSSGDPKSSDDSASKRDGSLAIEGASPPASSARVRPTLKVVPNGHDDDHDPVLVQRLIAQGLHR